MKRFRIDIALTNEQINFLKMISLNDDNSFDIEINDLLERSMYNDLLNKGIIYEVEEGYSERYIKFLSEIGEKIKEQLI
jgi:uncharacterized protein YwgA